jgi:hypothetical protein
MIRSPRPLNVRLTISDRLNLPTLHMYFKYPIYPTYIDTWPTDKGVHKTPYLEDCFSVANSIQALFRVSSKIALGIGKLFMSRTD